MIELLAHMNEQHSQLLHQLKRGHGDKRNKSQQVTSHARSALRTYLLRPDHWGSTSYGADSHKGVRRKMFGCVEQAATVTTRC